MCLFLTLQKPMYPPPLCVECINVSMSHVLISKIFFSSDICQLGATCHHAYLLTSDELYWQLQVQGCIFSQNILFWTQIFFGPKILFYSKIFCGPKIISRPKILLDPKIAGKPDLIGKNGFSFRHL